MDSFATTLVDKLFETNSCILKEQNPVKFKVQYLNMFLSGLRDASVINIAAPCGVGKSMIPFFYASLLQKCILENAYITDPKFPSIILLISSYLNILDMYESSCRSDVFPKCLGNVKAIMYKKNSGILGIQLLYHL